MEKCTENRACPPAGHGIISKQKTQHPLQLEEERKSNGKRRTADPQPNNPIAGKKKRSKSTLKKVVLQRTSRKEKVA
jgi:hypothetical protein